MAEPLDSQDSNEVYSGDPRIWGSISDILIVKEMSIATASDEIMYFTPDGIPETALPPKGPFPPHVTTGKGSRTISRATRAAINLDKGYVIQHNLRKERPIAFSRSSEYDALSGKDDDAGMNPSEMGAVGKLTDIFRVSIAANVPDPFFMAGSGSSGSPPEDAPADKVAEAKSADKALAEAWESRSSYNDKFGTYPGRKDLVYGRLEIRIASHFYANNRRTGPLFFSVQEWPRDEDDDGETEFPRGIDRVVELNQGIDLGGIEDFGKIAIFKESGDGITAPKDGVSLEYKMAGQILTGALAFNRSHHAWGVLVALPGTSNCNILNEDLSKETIKLDPTVDDVGFDDTGLVETEKVTIDERIMVFSKDKCPTVKIDSYTVVCATSLLTSYLSCKEISKLKYGDRWITITDRFNSLLNEIDNIYCIIKALDFKIEDLAEIVKSNIDTTDSIIDFLIKNIPKFALKPTIAEIDLSLLIGLKMDALSAKGALSLLPDVCLDGDVIPPPPVVPPVVPPAPPPPGLPPSILDILDISPP